MLLATLKIQVTNPTTTADKLEISREIFFFCFENKNNSYWKWKNSYFIKACNEQNSNIGSYEVIGLKVWVQYVKQGFQ